MAKQGPAGTIAADAVHEHLRKAILSAEYRPNYRLVEQDLSAQLNVSRTPVREALLRLKQEGLVVQRKGWIVRDHAPHEIIELLEARAEFDGAYEGDLTLMTDLRILARTVGVVLKGTGY